MQDGVFRDRIEELRVTVARLEGNVSQLDVALSNSVQEQELNAVVARLENRISSEVVSNFQTWSALIDSPRSDLTPEEQLQLSSVRDDVQFLMNRVESNTTALETALGTVFTQVDAQLRVLTELLEERQQRNQN